MGLGQFSFHCLLQALHIYEAVSIGVQQRSQAQHLVDLVGLVHLLLVPREALGRILRALHDDADQHVQQGKGGKHDEDEQHREEVGLLVPHRSPERRELIHHHQVEERDHRVGHGGEVVVGIEGAHVVRPFFRRAWIDAVAVSDGHDAEEREDVHNHPHEQHDPYHRLHRLTQADDDEPQLAEHLEEPDDPHNAGHPEDPQQQGGRGPGAAMVGGKLVHDAYDDEPDVQPIPVVPEVVHPHDGDLQDYLQHEHGHTSDV
mmetsp:Transcript_167601/g.538249  ORF Transcript_167601/g.538249 Transcript_167601/m.538249 type:complete len:259 (-) Transcript_167601:558-1334(-)